MKDFLLSEIEISEDIKNIINNDKEKYRELINDINIFLGECFQSSAIAILDIKNENSFNLEEEMKLLKLKLKKEFNYINFDNIEKRKLFDILYNVLK